MFERNKDKDQDKQAKTDSSMPEQSAAGKFSSSMPSNTATATSRSIAMIGSTIKIKGEVSGGEDLVIDGSVEGSIDLNSNQLTVGDSGKVKADIKGKTVIVNGQVTGDITGGEKVIISKNGNVRGNIVTPRMTLEDGAVFKGSIDMDPNDSSGSKASSPSSAKPTSEVTNLEVKKA